MVRRLSTLLVLVVAFAAPAHAQGTVLLPGLTYDRAVEFTPHGAVVVHVLTAPRPGDQNGLFQLVPVLAQGTVLGGREPVTQIERDVSAQATVAGINGDLFGAGDGHPAGIFMTGGVLAHPPFGSRSSIGVDSAGALHVDRVKFFGTWQGTGQRRTLNGVDQVPAQGQVVLLHSGVRAEGAGASGLRRGRAAVVPCRRIPTPVSPPPSPRSAATAASRSRPAARSSRRPGRRLRSFRPRRRSARRSPRA